MESCETNNHVLSYIAVGNSPVSTLFKTEMIVNKYDNLMFIYIFEVGILASKQGQSNLRVIADVSAINFVNTVFLEEQSFLRLRLGLRNMVFFFLICTELRDCGKISSRFLFLLSHELQFRAELSSPESQSTKIQLRLRSWGVTRAKPRVWQQQSGVWSDKQIFIRKIISLSCSQPLEMSFSVLKDILN